MAGADRPKPASTEVHPSVPRKKARETPVSSMDQKGRLPARCYTKKSPEFTRATHPVAVATTANNTTRSRNSAPVPTIAVPRERSLEETEEKTHGSEVTNEEFTKILHRLIGASDECERLASLSLEQQSEMINRIQQVERVLYSLDYHSEEEFNTSFRNLIAHYRIIEEIETANSRTTESLTRKRMNQQHQEPTPQLMEITTHIPVPESASTTTNEVPGPSGNEVPEPSDNTRKENNRCKPPNRNPPAMKPSPKLANSQSTRLHNDPNTKPPKAQKPVTGCYPSTKPSNNDPVTQLPTRTANRHAATSTEPKINDPNTKLATMAIAIPHQILPNPMRKPSIDTRSNPNPIGCTPAAIQPMPVDHGNPKPPSATNLSHPEHLADSNSNQEPQLKATPLKPHRHQIHTENTTNTRNTGRESNKSGREKSLVPTMSENVHRANQRIQEEWNGQRCKSVIMA
jgi:hypothetical protein